MLHTYVCKYALFMTIFQLTFLESTYLGVYLTYVHIQLCSLNMHIVHSHLCFDYVCVHILFNDL